MKAIVCCGASPMMITPYSGIVAPIVMVSSYWPGTFKEAMRPSDSVTKEIKANEKNQCQSPAPLSDSLM